MTEQEIREIVDRFQDAKGRNPRMYGVCMYTDYSSYSQAADVLAKALHQKFEEELGDLAGIRGGITHRKDREMTLREEIEQILDDNFEISKMKEDKFISSGIPETLKEFEIAKKESADAILSKIQEMLPKEKGVSSEECTFDPYTEAVKDGYNQALADIKQSLEEQGIKTEGENENNRPISR